MNESIVARLALVFLVLTACSPAPDQKVSKTLQVSAEKLAEIRSNPHVKRFKRGSDPAARLAGLEGDAWPAGILFMTMDPYLEDLGLDPAKMIIEINGKKV